MTVNLTMTNEEYHAHPAIGKSSLWTLYNKSPRHMKFGVYEDKQQFSFGTAGHYAILQPELFEANVVKGPVDRRGNKWTEAKEAAGNKTLLIESDYDDMQRLRDSASADDIVQRLRSTKLVVEASGFWMDEETSVMCKCRPDIYSPDLQMIADLKTTTNASPAAFKRRIAENGYHLQDVFYSDGWSLAGGGEVDSFVFLVVEDSAPFVFQSYELSLQALKEGAAIYRKALRQYATCAKFDTWPAYGGGVVELDLNKWDYKETSPSTNDF